MRMLKQSGKASREPGIVTMDVYSNLNDVHLMYEPNQI